MKKQLPLQDMLLAQHYHGEDVAGAHTAIVQSGTHCGLSITPVAHDEMVCLLELRIVTCLD